MLSLLFQIKPQNIKMIEIVNGCVFVDGVETVSPELIGFAILDFAETQENDGISIVLKEQDVFIELQAV
jgi:ribosomal protein S19